MTYCRRCKHPHGRAGQAVYCHPCAELVRLAKRRAWYRHRRTRHTCPWCGRRTRTQALCRACGRKHATRARQRRKERS